MSTSPPPPPATPTATASARPARNKVFGNKAWVLSFVLLLVTVIAGALTYYLQPDNFAVTLTSSLFGSALSFVLAFWLVDRLNAAQKEREWVQTRRLMFEQLAESLRSVLLEYTYQFNLDRKYLKKFKAGKVWGEEEREVFSKFLFGSAMELNKKLEELVKDKCKFVAAVRELHTRIESRLNHITNGILPWMIQLSTDRVLIDELVRFAGECLELRRVTEQAGEEMWDEDSGEQWRIMMGVAVEEFLHQSAAVSKALSDRWPAVAASAG